MYPPCYQIRSGVTEPRPGDHLQSYPGTMPSWTQRPSLPRSILALMQIRASNKGYPKVGEVFTITEDSLRHYAKRTLTPR